MPEDMLVRLNRVLLNTPVHSLATPPLPRRMLVEIVSEIRYLRARVTELQARVNQQPDAAARDNNHETPTDS